ncbi:hypothetical protein ACQP0C_15235 [Nocardia sp. CA-129566]|uniref:hypothetical protein n=1 Tax=Nocardia sp. CA-129566 TaxID=3239976 RepID=UPI003D97A830
MADSFVLGRIVSAGDTLDRLAAHAGDLLRKDVGVAATGDIEPGIVLTAAATLGLVNHTR